MAALATPLPQLHRAILPVQETVEVGPSYLLCAKAYQRSSQTPSLIRSASIGDTAALMAMEQAQEGPLR